MLTDAALLLGLVDSMFVLNTRFFAYVCPQDLSDKLFNILRDHWAFSDVPLEYIASQDQPTHDFDNNVNDMTLMVLIPTPRAPKCLQSSSEVNNGGFI